MSADYAVIRHAVQHYQKSLERSQNDGARLLHCIQKLYKLPVKVEHLQETGVGKTVNALRKIDGEVGVAAKALVTKWKAMVAAEQLEDNQNDVAEYQETNGRGSGESDEDKNGNKEVEEEEEEDIHKEEEEDVHKEEETPRSSEHERTERHKSDKKDRHKSSREHTQPERKESSSKRHHRERNEPSREKSSTEKVNLENNKISQHHLKSETVNREQREQKRKRDDIEERRESKRSKHSSEHKKDKINNKNSSSDTNNVKNKEDRKSSDHQHRSSKEKSQHSSERESKHTKHSSSRDKHESSHSKSKHKHGHHKDSPKDKDDNLNEKPQQPKISDSKPSTSKSNSPQKRPLIDPSQQQQHTIPKKAKTEKPLKNNTRKNDEDEQDAAGIEIDCSTGANFADVLGMLDMPTKKVKKNINALKTNATSPEIKSAKELPTSSSSSNKSRKVNSPSSSTSTKSKRTEDKTPALLTSSIKLDPLDPSIALDLPPISTNYKPLPLNQTVMDCIYNTSNSSASKAQPRLFSEAEALAHGISSKTMRTKIYSGIRTGVLLQVPTLFDLCIRMLQKNLDALEYTGGVPYEVLRPVLERATAQQLFGIEQYNPYLLEDTDELWMKQVQFNFRTKKRQELESWREMYMRCQEEEERKLSMLAENIKQSQKIAAAPVRKTQLAFVDTYVKPPRNVQRKQEQYGTKAKVSATPAARVAALSAQTPNAAKPGDARLRVAASVRDQAQVSHSAVRPKKAPLMAKTLQFMRGRLKR